MPDPLITLAIAVAAMLAAVLWLRLHPFLALLGAALIVVVLTDRAARIDQLVTQRGVKVESAAADESTVQLELANSVPVGRVVVFRRIDSPWRERVGEAVVSARVDAQGDVAYFVDEAVDLRAGDWIVGGAEYQTVEQELREQMPGEVLAEGLASTFRNIGIPIAMAAIIGTCLMESGGAHRLVLSLKSALGANRTAPALGVSGFTLGIPVFFDTVFYLLLPLAKALYRQTGHSYLLYVLAIVVGATMTHSLVPPTPGPLYVASQLGIGTGTMINAGLLLGIVTSSCGYCYALWANRRWEIRPASIAVEEKDELDAGWTNQTMPPLALAMLPILLPVVLLGGHSFLDSTVAARGLSGAAARLWPLAGDKHLVLMFSAVIALCLLRWSPKRRRGESRRLVGHTLADAGVIILLTCAGGAFGAALRTAGIAAAIQYRFPDTSSGLGLLVLAFSVTAIVRIAQGSATVAMITAAGIIGPIMQSATLEYHPVYVALALGCGSKPLPWMNDSGFWVVATMSGMDELQTIKTVSVAMTVMGLAGFAAVLVAASVFPLAGPTAL